MTSYDWATTRVLWQRDILRFWRQPSRIVGALGQPIIFWLVIGSGMAATFKLPGQSVGYLEYFYPGVVLMVLLFASIFSAVSVMEDRHQGFLQAILAGPASRPAIVLGKCLGSTTVALFQAGIFLLLLPLAGFNVANIDWLLLFAVMLATSLGLTAIGFGLAWWLDNMQAYHAISMTFLMPLWVISGAMFPAAPSQVFHSLMLANPIAYAVSATRQALYGGAAPIHTVIVQSPYLAAAVVGIFGLLSLWLAMFVCQTRR